MNILKLLDRKDKTKVLLICIGTIFSTLVFCSPVIFLEKYIDSVVSNNEVIYIAIIMGACYLLMELVQAAVVAMANYVRDKQQLMIGTLVQRKLFRKYLNISYSHIMKTDFSDITNMLLEDISLIMSKCLKPITEIISAITQLVFGIVYLMSMSWLLVILIFPLGLITAVLSVATEKKYIDNATMRKTTSQNLWKSFSEIFRGIIPIRIYARNNDYAKKVDSHIEQYLDISNTQNKLEKRNYVVASSLYMLTIAIMVIVTAVLVVNNKLTIGGMVAVQMFNHMLTDPLITILQTKRDAAELKVVNNRLMNILNTSVVFESQERRTPINEIKIENLSFTYENEGNEKVLDNFNLHIKLNEHIAIMGETGSGKSTLCKLIAGLYNDYEGSIVYYKDGVQVDTLPTISYLYQNAYIFDDTIEANIRLSNPNATDEEVHSVIECSVLSGVVKVHGNERLGENGEKLSGGEKARLLLAQCLLKNDSSLYIFDELSSSLDDETFVAIMQNIKHRLQDKIVIFVEHNNLIKDYVDRIVVIER